MEQSQKGVSVNQIQDVSLTLITRKCAFEEQLVKQLISIKCHFAFMILVEFLNESLHIRTESV